MKKLTMIMLMVFIFAIGNCLAKDPPVKKYPGMISAKVVNTIGWLRIYSDGTKFLCGIDTFSKRNLASEYLWIIVKIKGEEGNKTLLLCEFKGMSPAFYTSWLREKGQEIMIRDKSVYGTYSKGGNKETAIIRFMPEIIIRFEKAKDPPTVDELIERDKLNKKWERSNE